MQNERNGFLIVQYYENTDQTCYFFTHPTDYFTTRRKKYYDHFKLILTILLLMRVHSILSLKPGGSQLNMHTILQADEIPIPKCHACISHEIIVLLWSTCSFTRKWRHKTW